MNIFNKAPIFIGLYICLLGLGQVEPCTSFYCINSCGASKTDQSKKGYKMILANNRDEDIYRLTIPASVWPPKNPKFKSQDTLNCDQSQYDPPFNLCVYGALDFAKDKPPNYYSTWLGINERGDAGNLLFYMQPSTNITEVQGRGVIVGSYLQNSSWISVKDFMQHLSDTKHQYKPFNYVQLAMSPYDGSYSLYYVNNNKTKPYQKLNPDDKNTFIFGLSNSDSVEPFNKVITGKQKFKDILNDFALNNDKQNLIDRIIQDVLQDTNPNFPDELLKAYMRVDIDDVVKGVSQINADYSSYWKNAHSRTSTLILVDYDDNVEYYEYNLSSLTSLNAKKVVNKSWQMNSFSFKLNPLYKRFETENSSFKMLSSPLTILNVILFFFFIN